MTEIDTVRQALVAELRQYGLTVQADTCGHRSVYVMGPNDLALALFEFYSSVDDAIQSLCRGSWSAELPPRFVVLPKRSQEESGFELVGQMNATPLLYSDENAPEFPELDSLLAMHRLA